MPRQSRILIVDDDESYLLILSRRLERRDHKVETARNGREALRKALEFIPDLVISDWMMPELSGEEFCRALKEHDKLKWTYFIMLTAKGRIEDLVKGLEGGADDFLIKPCDDRELMARIRTGLRIVALQRENARLERIEAISQTAVTLSHEINNPLQAIIGTAELVMQQTKGFDTGLKETLHKIIQNAQRIREVTKTLENVIEAESMEYVPGGPKMIDIERSTTRNK